MHAQGVLLHVIGLQAVQFARITEAHVSTVTIDVAIGVYNELLWISLLCGIACNESGGLANLTIPCRYTS